MLNPVFDIATTVINKADRDHPADAVLRIELKRQQRLSRESSRETALTVFAYYRWFGWLDQQQPMSQQLFQAVELSRRFQHGRASFTDDELLAKALPPWVAGEVVLSADWLRALQSEPPVWLRARPDQGRSLASRLGDSYLVDDLRDAICYEGAEDLFRTPEFQDGEFELQDLSSQVVGWICSPQPTEKWWDACAGEGGKTLHLADLMQNKGLIWASDRAEWRLKKLRLRAARAKLFNYRAVLWNGGEKLPTKTKFDGILIDAPCSGMGTWHRNPQARWTTTPADVAELGAIQDQLLSHATSALKPGGRLVYAVCTLSKRETTDVVAALTQRFPELQPLATVNPLHPEAPPSSQHLMGPRVKGGNGMFVATWRKVQ
ncbi:MAG: RsmB/NOP family class I SAM-dependent RNA methyltransferase [Pedosphaera sp.]|nr:RsmB/NOP family class I SAM-dependent RNA methyltransferase [Pedosphaera sp.]